jgi:hypothetical protein
MKRLTAATLLVVLTSPEMASALAGDKAAYVGGTIARFNTPGKRIEGRLEIGPRQLACSPSFAPGSPTSACPSGSPIGW